MDHGFYIGTKHINGRVIMAPLAGIGGPVFRSVAHQHGAALVVTPLICAEALVRKDQRTWDMAEPELHEAPRAVQIFGSDPSIMADAAHMLEERGEKLIDLNFGCPSRRITANGAGSALMRYPEKLATIAEKVASAISIPVTAKIRLGWNRQNIVVIEVVKALEDAGMGAVTIHARTKSDSPADPASWKYIAEAVSTAKCPIIGNGGIGSALDAFTMFEQTRCAAVMIGRAAVGRPWLLNQAHEALLGRTVPSDPTWKERLAMAQRHVALQYDLDPRGQYLHSTQGVASAYMRGMPGARRIRPRVFETETYTELDSLLAAIADRLTAHSKKEQ